MCDKEKRPVPQPLAALAACAIALAAFLPAGCDKALETYREGEDLLAHNQYDLAVSRFDSALQQCRRQKRDCSMYTDKLAHARRLAAEHYFNLASADFIAARFDIAAARIAKALEYEPANPACLELRQRILDETIAAETLRRSALDHAAQKQWDAAIEMLQQAMARNRTLSGAQADLDKVKRDAYAHHLADARGFLESGDWDAAAAEASLALKYQSGPEAKAILSDIANRRSALEFIQQASALKQAGADPQTVLDTLEKARRLYPSHPEIAALILDAKRAVCDEKIALAVRAHDAGALHEALRLLNQSTRLIKDYGGAADLIARITPRIAQRHADLGDEFRQRNLYGNAALHYLTAMNYRDGLAQARTGLAECTSVLRDSVRYSVGYVGFNSSPQDRRTANAFEAAILQHINRTRPANIVIKDVSALKATLAALNENIVRVDLLDARIESARPADVDAFLMAQVLANDLNAADTVTWGQSHYQSAVRMDPNPEYPTAQAAVDKLFIDHAASVVELTALKVQATKIKRREDENDADFRRRTTDARRMVEDAEKKTNKLYAALQNARQHLANTPPHLATPIISEHTYAITKVTKTAQIAVFLKMIDARTGAVLIAEKLEASHSATDTFVLPDPARNVPGDPLELPADDLIMKKAADQITAKLFGLCDSYFAGHPKRFIAVMNQSASDGDEDTAVEYAMRYLITPNAAGSDRNKTLSFLGNIVASRKEGAAPDLNALLARYCKF